MNRVTKNTLSSDGVLRACGGTDCRDNNGDCRKCTHLKEALTKLKNYEDKDEHQNTMLRCSIEEALIRCNLPMSLCGYGYLIEILLILEERPYIKMASAYRLVAQEVQSTPHLVEMNIKNILVRSRRDENAEIFDQYFGTNIKNTATAIKTFLSSVHRYIEKSENHE